MKKQLTPEQRAKRLKTWIQVGGFILLGCVVAPIVGLAIYGLAGIIVAGIIGFTTIQLVPVFAMKMENWKLKALKAEARKNPVETLQSELRRRQASLNEKKDSIELFIGKVKTFEGKLDSFGQRYPTEVPRFQSTLNQMQQLAKVRKENYRKAKFELALFEEQIEKAGAIWEMGQVAADTAEGSGMSEDEFYAKIKVETAMDAVTDSMNQAFAQLEVSLLDSEDKPQFEPSPVQRALAESTNEAIPVAFRETVKST